MATIGSQLETPEIGWKRYDDANPTIERVNAPVISSPNSYNGTETRPEEIGATISFKFKGTKIRIIGARNYGSSDISIKIDDVTEKYSCDNSLLFQCLLYEKTGLEDTIHSVVITNNQKKYLWFDAVDIDPDGYILHPKEVMTVKELEVGKRIRCHYKASSNSTGKLSNLGRETYVDGNNDFIPYTGSLAPNGDFYFICVGYDKDGRKKLIADRNIQHSVSWDTLNNSGLVYEYKEEWLQYNYVIPVAYSGTVFSGYSYDSVSDGNPSTIWYSKGGGGNPDVDIINMDYGREYEITRFSLQATGLSCKDFDIRYSDDNSTWNIAYSGIMSSDGKINTVTFDSVGSHRYWSIYIKSTYGSGASSGLCEAMAWFKIIDNENFSIRLLTGGISAIDKDNEWDKIIVESDLNKTITPGDNNIWNWYGIYSWISTSDGVEAKRGARGGNTLSAYGDGVTSAVVTNVGYRPVLLVESLSTTKYLLKDGNSLKSIDSGVLTHRAFYNDDIAIRENAFLSYGMDSLPRFTKDILSQINNVEGEFKVMIYEK